MLFKKPIELIAAEARASNLTAVLGPVQLMLLGVGCIIGAGIFVMTGTAAASYAGPGVMLSFLLAGFACAFAGLSYAELASTMPASGSAYTYAYASLGEVFAWIMGWLLLLEYGVAAAFVSVGFAGYLTSLLASLGISLPVGLSTSMIDSANGPGGLTFFFTGHFNVIAVAAVVAVAALQIWGIRQSAAVTNFFVVVKLAVLIAFVAFASHAINPNNWHPLIPAAQGPFTFGIGGVFRAASVVFVSYLGFEAVSVAAGEARNPQRDVPIGIIGALIICTIVYIAVSAVMTGVVSYTKLGVPDPVAVAVDAVGMGWMGLLVKIGAVAGLGSVLLVLIYSLSRVGFAISRDGLLPPSLGRLHPKFATPYVATMVLGTIVAVGAGVLPIALLADLISVGTASAFAIVAICVMWLRSTHPEIHRPFRVPFGGVRIGKAWIGVTPVLALAGALMMAVPTLADMIVKATQGQGLPLAVFVGYLLIGALFYAFYGMNRAKALREKTA
jgi:APA family basic amino acid/polyamine antiporter